MSVKLSGLLLVLLVLVCFCSQATAQSAQNCPRFPVNPIVNVVVNKAPLTLNHNLGPDELKNVGKLLISVYPSQEEHTLGGLTKNQFKLSSTYQLTGAKTKSISCLAFSTVTITMESTPIMYISSKLPANSCLYKEVYLHEMKHYLVEETLVDKYQKIIHDQMAAFINLKGVMGPYDNSYQLTFQNDLTKQLNALVDGIKEQMSQERIKLQGQIDTREEYRRVSKACPGEDFL